ncbi:hypothetical protein ABVT39_015850 [Epinephelus coioides]
MIGQQPRSVCFRSSVPRFPLSETSGIWEGGEKEQAERKRRGGEKRQERSEEDVNTQERRRRSACWHLRGPLCCKQVGEVGERRHREAAATDGGISGTQRVFFEFTVGDVVVAVMTVQWVLTERYCQGMLPLFTSASVIGTLSRAASH